MATLLKADGTEAPLLPAMHGRFTLEQLQAAVGGYIARVLLRDGRVLYVDEEGKLKGKRINRAASVLYPHDVIVGDAVVLERGEEDE